MEYLSNNRAHNCLDKWSTHKLSFTHMYCKLINIMILVIFLYTLCILLLYKMLCTIIYHIKVKVKQ